MTFLEAGLVLGVLMTNVVPWTEWKVLTTHASLPLLAIGLWRLGGSTPLDRPVMVYLGLVILSALLSRSPRFSIFPRPRRGDGVLTVLTYGLIALAAARLPQTAWIVWGCIVVGCLVSVLALGQAHNVRWARKLGGAKDNTDGAWGMQGNPTFLGGVLLLLLPLSVDQGVVGLCAAILLASALFCTGSRSAMLGLLVGTLLIVWTQPWYQSVPIGIGIVLGSLWSHRLMERTGLKSVAIDRGDLWGYVLQRIWKKPLIGHGPNMLALTVPDNRPEIHDAAHNELLEVTHMVGILGLGAYLWIWGTAIHTLNEITIGLLACGVWLMFTWSAIGVSNLMWLLLGLAVGR